MQRRSTRESGHFGLFIGTVHETADPEKLGRIRIVCPSVLGSVPSRWAFPLGTSGGGKASHGLVAIPPVGAMVGVFFNGGNPNAPFYISGWWPAPNREPATPTPTGQETGDPQNIVFETTRWRVWLRNVAGQQKLRIESKDDAAQFIEIDGASGDMTLSVSASKQLLLGDAGATEQAILGNAFLTFFNAHVHVETGGSTLAPTTPMTAAQLSAKVKVAT